MWSKLCHSTAEAWRDGASTRLPVSWRTAATVAFVLAVALVDQAMEPDASSRMRMRLPSAAMVSRDAAGSETGRSRLATHTGVRIEMLWYEMPPYQRSATPPSGWKKPSANLPPREMSFLSPESGRSSVTVSSARTRGRAFTESSTTITSNLMNHAADMCTPAPAIPFPRSETAATYPSVTFAATLTVTGNKAI
jgi:hypothetical protein